ncbi:MAG: hypothetical protein FD141_341 [Fusobacteria bacterium]|nr:MAG: hypothetical protein FD141_341 [Fusobacteriota bacterium]KAF0228994.1 MAG: hypothetical protein FD182_1250 [Fusobacteriota bacterium]
MPFLFEFQSILSKVEDNGVISLVVFDIDSVYKGDKSMKTITISIMGGLMDGDKFINSSIGKMFIEKGASEEELSSLYSGKNVRFAGFEGEMIPTEGESYIVFARNSIVKKDIYYIVGGGYDQGLLPIIDKNKVEEFNPEKRMIKVDLNNISIDQLIDESI